MNAFIEIINYISIFVSLIILLAAYCNIVNKSSKLNYIKTIILLISAFIILISNQINDFIIKTIMIVFSFYIPYYISKEKKEQNNLFYPLLALIIANVLDFVLSVFISIIPYNVVFNHFIDAVFTIVIPLLILFLYSNKTIKSAIMVTQKILRDKRAYLNYIFFAIVILTILSYINLNVNSSLIRISLFILVICFVFLIYSLLINKSKYDVDKIYINHLVNSLNNYLKSNDDLRKYKHNIKNKLLAINNLPNNQIKEYINNEILNSNSMTNTQIYNSSATSLITFIYEKCHQKKFNIKRIIIVNNMKDDTVIFNNPKLFIILCEILGISLDNAIEASEKNQKSKIIIELLETKSSIHIKMINEFIDNINIDKLGKALYTTKENGTGIGLYSMNTNKKVNTNYQIFNNKFICKASIQKNFFINKKTSLMI